MYYPKAAEVRRDGGAPDCALMEEGEVAATLCTAIYIYV